MKIEARRGRAAAPGQIFRRRRAQSLELAGNRRAHDRRPARMASFHIDLAVAEQSIQKKAVVYDDEDAHYDTISAFIKSMRGSDPDATLYWLAKMIHAGEDPRFIARRIVIHAAEDVGLADPMALVLANAAFQAAEFIGWPEARIPLAEAAIYIATANKSNSTIMAIDAALKDVESGRTLPVPEHLRDAHYQGAKRLGHGEGYKYAHDYPEHFVAQDYLGADKALLRTNRPRSGKENQRTRGKVARNGDCRGKRTQRKCSFLIPQSHREHRIPAACSRRPKETD